jgi:hypothetical protein
VRSRASPPARLPRACRGGGFPTAGGRDGSPAVRGVEHRRVWVTAHRRPSDPRLGSDRSNRAASWHGRRTRRRGQAWFAEGEQLCRSGGAAWSSSSHGWPECGRSAVTNGIAGYRRRRPGSCATTPAADTPTAATSPRPPSHRRARSGLVQVNSLPTKLIGVMLADHSGGSSRSLPLNRGIQRVQDPESRPFSGRGRLVSPAAGRREAFFMEWCRNVRDSPRRATLSPCRTERDERWW